MGVAIHAYSRMALTDPHTFDDACYDLDHYRTFVYVGHEQTYRGLADPDNVFVGYGRNRFVGGRCYVHTDESDHLRVMDTSYSGYGRWRESLCRAVHGVHPRAIWDVPDRWRDAPFFELIHFADNEGFIGPDAAADLLVDFTDHASAVAGIACVDDWLDGLRLAADAGFIQYR